MRKIVTITLAILFAALSTSAMAGGRYYDEHRRYDRGHRDAAIAGGVLLGLVAGAALSNRYDDRYYDRGYGYYNPPVYGREVVVIRPAPRYYYAPPRYNTYYAPPRRVVYRDRGYRGHGYRDRGYRDRGYRHW